MMKTVAGWITVIALALVLIASLGWQTVRVPGDEVAIAECRAAYGRARSAAESLGVDERQPVVSRTQATVALTCAARRRSGQLAARTR